MKQKDLGLDLSNRRTRKRVLLEEMDQVMPWSELLALITPHAPVAKTGRPPFDLAMMLRIHCLQQWFGLSDLGTEEALFETAAPSSNKNSTGERDPEMHQVNKGNQWHFGMKAHIGVDADSGLVHTVMGTTANVNDVTQGYGLLHGEEEVVFGDAGYQGVDKREEATGVAWQVAMRPGKRKAQKHTPLGALTEQAEKLKASVRAKVEHPFRVIKRQFGHCKVRYPGLKKNTAQLITLFALSNIRMVRSRILQRAQEGVSLQTARGLQFGGKAAAYNQQWMELALAFHQARHIRL